MDEPRAGSRASEVMGLSRGIEAGWQDGGELEEAREEHPQLNRDHPAMQISRSQGAILCKGPEPQRQKSVTTSYGTLPNIAACRWDCRPETRV